MSSPCPDPESILDSIDRLAAFAETTAAKDREASVAAEDRERAIQRRVEAALRGSEEYLKADLDRLRIEGAERAARIRARFERRAQRIKHAKLSVRKSAAQRAEAEEGRRKFEIQREMLRATRERDAGLAEAKRIHDSLLGRLHLADSRLAQSESRAQRLFSVLGRGTLDSLSQAHTTSRIDTEPPEDTLASNLDEQLETLDRELAAFARRILPSLSRGWPFTLVLILSPLAVAPVLQHFGIRWPSWIELGSASGALSALAIGAHFLGRHLARPAIRGIVESIGRARLLLHESREKGDRTHATTRTRLESDHEDVARRCNQTWSELAAWLEENRGSLPARADERAREIAARNDSRLAIALAQADEHLRSALNDARTEDTRRSESARLEAEQSRLASAMERERATSALLDSWKERGLPIAEFLLHAARRLGESPPVDIPRAGFPWAPPSRWDPCIRFGHIEIDFDRLLDRLPAHATFPGRPAGRHPLPLAIEVPGRGSLLLESDATGRQHALGTLNRVAGRLLAATPPGRLALTVFDPIGLGQSFAGLTHLADEADHLIHGRIWTQSSQLEERLAEIGDHLEKVIQMYLRNEFPTIAEYNAQAGTIAEKYRFLLIADFPAGFTDLALRRLEPILSSGPRCGVFVLIHRDTRLPIPHDFPWSSWRKSICRLTLPAGGTQVTAVTLNDQRVPDGSIQADRPALADDVNAFVQQVGRAHRDSHRIEVAFNQIAPLPHEFWSGDSSDELRVPIGRAGATKLQYLVLGKGTRQHALVAGKTGSGKSTLFHVLVTNLSLWFRPDQVEFYLVDFKKGVEFKCYATHRLPHARAVAIESDREFGLSILQRLDEELRRRGDLFRAARVQDLGAYRRSPRAEPMPRVLLLVDEFQELFVEEDRIAQNASVLLDRIVRQGRAFGIHVILGSQTLGGAYTVARTTLGQMAIRIALQCNEADALLIMDDENPAPRLLSRPGEAIYNDASGIRTANSPFQVVWMTDHERNARLAAIRQAADASERPLPGPLVFEGDAPADVHDNPSLWSILREPATPTPRTQTPRVWLGAPNAIKDPTSVGLSRRAGDNLLVVGQREDVVLALFGINIAALAREHLSGTPEITILDGTAPNSADRAYFERLARTIPRRCRIAGPANAAETIRALHETLKSRNASPPDPSAPPRYLVVHGLQSFRDLRTEDEFGFSGAESPATAARLFREILSDGPPHGIHAFVACDTLGTVTRYLGRKGLADFAYRVLFQMSANDSATLVDNPAASRLGLHRALLYSDRDGFVEVFRPYSLVSPESLVEPDVATGAGA